MEQQILTKNETIRKMKKGSGIISFICFATAVLYFLILVVVPATRPAEYIAKMNSGNSMEKISCMHILTTYLMNSSTLFLAAIVFFRIYKSGCPFINSNIIIVRVIGLLFIVNGVLNAALPAVWANDVKFLVSMINPSGVAAGMLVICISYIMKYASLLQIESDETL